MNELQRVEFNILKTTIEIINQLNLKYYLVCGSALGAIKYGGFIPWDDDVDIALPREDYDIFVKLAPQFLPQYYFLQNYQTDERYNLIFTKIRDTRTTFIEKKSVNLPIVHGVFIDVFPLDGYPSTKFEERIFLWKLKKFRILQNCTFSTNENWNWKMKIIIWGVRKLGRQKHIGKDIKKMENILKRYPLNESTLWCNYGNSASVNEYAPREHYGSGIMVKFEGLDVRVPEMYDEYLTQKYGDWRAELPESEQIGHHYYTICDLNVSYNKYTN